MKYLFCLLLLLANCGTLILPKDVITVSKCETRSDGNCNFIMSVPKAWDLMINDFPCDCFRVGDTINIARLGNKEKAITCVQQPQPSNAVNK